MLTGKEDLADKGSYLPEVKNILHDRQMWRSFIQPHRQRLSSWRGKREGKRKEEEEEREEEPMSEWRDSRTHAVALVVVQLISRRTCAIVAGDCVDALVSTSAVVHRTLVNVYHTRTASPTWHNYLRQEGCVFTRVCLSVCMSANRITQKLPIKYLSNFVKRLDIIQGPID